jgi:geranylgeranyl pyrophosphate synthase
MMEALKKYEPMQSEIERCNAMVLTILESSRVREARIAAESFKNGGKRLRPMLMILSSMASNGSSRNHVPDSLIQLASAVELVHLATLFHDDVIDEVESRRTRLSARVKYGNFVSVLAGDYVLTEALLLVQRSGAHHTMPEFLETIRVLVSGESLETNHKFDFGMSEQDYFDIISEKSASLFALSCKVGAMSIHSDRSVALGDFGWNLGMAFQMIDDLDDMLGITNGSMDCDLKNGYLALPVIRLLSALDGPGREELIDLIRLGEFGPEEETRLAMLCTEHGGLQHARKEIGSHLDRAKQNLERFDTNGGAEMLRSIVSDLQSYADGQVRGFYGVAKGRV